MNSPIEPPRVAFIIPYIGAWPRWSQLFFESCRFNTNVDVILLCQAGPPFALTGNVRVAKMTRAEIIGRLEKVTGLSLGNMGVHKISDLKPFYGLAFADLLNGYTFWGYCDVDMMFGSLGKLLTDEFLKSIDLFTAHNEYFMGHFTILRNIQAINRLCFEIENWKECCLAPAAVHVDEQLFAEAVRKNPHLRWKKPSNLSDELKGSFARFGITFAFFGEVAYLQPSDNPVVRWEKGSCYFENSNGRVTEVLYVHFMGTKRWWHWLFFNKTFVLQPAHYFSRIGYLGVRHPSELHQFPWRQFYWLQSLCLRFKIIVGALLRRLLSKTTFLAIRRKLGI